MSNPTREQVKRLHRHLKKIVRQTAHLDTAIGGVADQELRDSAILAEAYLRALDVVEAARPSRTRREAVRKRTQMREALKKFDGGGDG